jgi:hypothetical protein
VPEFAGIGFATLGSLGVEARAPQAAPAPEPAGAPAGA